MCRMSHMPTNLAIDDRLLEEALRVGGHRTKKATVTEALEEYIRRRKQARVLKLFGKVEFDPAYNYKRQRRRGWMSSSIPPSGRWPCGARASRLTAAWKSSPSSSKRD